MAKKKGKVEVFPEASAVVAPEPVVIVEVIYSFPTRSRCPGCKSHRTIAVRTDVGIQYRKCLLPHCQSRYKVDGIRI